MKAQVSRKNKPENAHATRVVAIGTAADGLSTLGEIVGSIPAHSRMAFVFLQTGGPGISVDLLQENCPLPVQEVNKEVELMPGRMYVVPAGNTIQIKKERLRLTKLKHFGWQDNQAPINALFEALAETYGVDAVGVLLAGTGTDGAAGLTAIKSKGGLAIVHDKAQGAFGRAPDGDVDWVLPGNEILAKILASSTDELFTTVADTIAQFAWMADEKGSIYWYNKRWYDYTGTTLEEMQGWGWMNVHHPDHVDRVVKRIQHSWDTGELWEDTFPLRSKDGGYRWFLSRAVPIRDEKGRIVRWVGTNTDITEQRDAQALAEYREALLQAHNNSSIDGILLVDARGKILSMNRRFAEIWSMPQWIIDAKNDDAALAFAMTRLVDPKQFIEKVKYLYEHPTESTVDVLEFTDGKIVERHGYPVLDSNGSFYSWSWTFRDITLEKIAERKVQESERNFRQLADLLPDKVATATPVGEITYFSSTWEEYTGIPLQQLMEDGLEAVVHPEDRESFVQRWREATAGTMDFEMEFRIASKKAGAYHWHLSRATAVLDEAGRKVRWLVSTSEIQGQREIRMELEKAVAQRTAELQAANQLLVKKNQDLESFAYISSHDLQEPLRKIQIFTTRIEHVEKSKLSETAQDYFSRIRKSANRMQVLIQDLLVYARVGSLDNEFVQVPVGKVVGDVLLELKELIRERNAVVETDLKHEACLIVFQFHQVIHNLLTNSLKFSRAGVVPHIVIRDAVDLGENFMVAGLKPDIRYVHISFSDNGIGFDQKYSEKIFEVFQRLFSRDQYPGTGIGLAIVKKIVENHNGLIVAKSAVDEGAVFDIYIPEVHRERK